MFVRLFNENPNPREVRKIVEVLRNGGLIIYPTDTVYAMGCDITNPKAVDKVARWKGVKIEKSNFSFICSVFSHLSDYTKPIPSSIFKLIRKKFARTIYFYS